MYHEEIEKHVEVENYEDVGQEEEIQANIAGIPPLDQCYYKKLCLT